MGLDREIPLGTFIEFTWHSAGPEPEEVWDIHGENRDVESVELIRVVGENLAPSEVILSDSTWKPRGDLND